MQRAYRLGINILIPCTSMLLLACQEAPVTQRSQFIIVPESQVIDMGADAYRQIRADTPVSNDAQMNRMVNEVGSRIASVADDPGYEWEFTVFQDDSPNAFALPGGKVGVNSGLFKVVENESQLAAVMAHEVAHAIARHSAERMSRQIALQGGLAVAGATSETVAQYSQVLAQAATLGIVLPFSRDQEAEADEIGLTYMARAGYDPRAAVQLWQNFATYGGDRPPEFLSTHPSPGSRIERLQKLMPKAMEIYRSQS
jgi:predicted Zn-dependent protease